MDTKKYILMQRDIPILSFSAYKYFFDDIQSVITPELMPIGAGRDGKQFEWWLDSRIIPYKRIRFLESMPVKGIKNPRELAFLTHGLSLLNQYWIKEEEEDLSWREINLFDNDFSEYIGKALFNHRSFSSDGLPPAYIYSPEGMSPGDQNKRWMIDSDKNRILIKGDTDGELAANEVLASLLARETGLKHVLYKLNVQDGKYISESRCFTSRNTEIIHAMDLLYEFGMPENYRSTEYYYKYMIDLFERMGVEDAGLFIDKMLAVDYIMGQTDRHYNNFGLLHNIENDSFCMAPLYDSGNANHCRKPTSSINLDEEIIGKPFGPNGQIGLDKQIINIKTGVYITPDIINKVEREYRNTLDKIEISEERKDMLVNSLYLRTEKMMELLDFK